MAEPIDRNVTFRAQIMGETADLLQAEGISCQYTCSMIVTLAALLSAYKEDGVSLVPSILVCNSIEELSASLPGSKIIRLAERQV